MILYDYVHMSYYSISMSYIYEGEKIITKCTYLYVLNPNIYYTHITLKNNRLVICQNYKILKLTTTSKHIRVVMHNYIRFRKQSSKKAKCKCTNARKIY